MINKLNKTASLLIGRELTKTELENALLLNASFKTKNELLVFMSKIMSEAPNMIVEAMQASKTMQASKAGKQRAENDPAHKSLKIIELEEYPKIKHSIHLRGRKKKFITDMFAKFQDIKNSDSIKNLVTKLNKENGITQIKKAK